MTGLATQVGPVYMQAGMLFIADGTTAIDPAAIAAVEWKPWVSQASAARVLIHLAGGQTIPVFFGEMDAGNERALLAFQGILAVVRQRTATRIVTGVLSEDDHG